MTGQLGQVAEWLELAAPHDAELHLTLLHPRHTERWFEHHQDPRVAQLCRLPAFVSRVRVAHWLSRCWAESNAPASAGRAQCFSFAVEHAQEGLIGSVRLHRHESRAFFSFWVGPRHQRRGFGSRAATLATRALAPLLQTDELLTATYPGNLPSCLALERSGWRRLTLESAPPEIDASFWRWSLRPALDDESMKQSFTPLLTAIGSDLRFAASEHEDRGKAQRAFDVQA